MNKQEISKLVTVLMAAYPTYYSKLDKQEMINLVNAWYIVLGDYSYDVGQAGVKMYLSNDTKGFPPSPGQVVDCIYKVKSMAAGDTMSEGEMWDIVYNAIRNSAYNSVEEFNKLPKRCQKLVGSPSILKQYAMMDESELSFVQAQFFKNFRTLSEREKENAKIPSSVMALISGMPIISNNTLDGQQLNSLEQKRARSEVN